MLLLPVARCFCWLFLLVVAWDLFFLSVSLSQGIARRGHYGAYLLEEPELVMCVSVSCVTVSYLVPLSVSLPLCLSLSFFPFFSLSFRFSVFFSVPLFLS